jgi:hypothetical protein
MLEGIKMELTSFFFLLGYFCLSIVIMIMIPIMIVRTITAIIIIIPFSGITAEAET